MLAESDLPGDYNASIMLVTSERVLVGDAARWRSGRDSSDRAETGYRSSDITSGLCGRTRAPRPPK